MVTPLPAAAHLAVSYPDRNGNLIADNTKQFEWIVLIKKNLDLLVANNPNIFVAGDLPWYPIDGNSKICTAPDVLVAFGRPKGTRGCYKQWEEDNIPPQVVFEVLSPSNTQTEMDKKLLFYDRHGVEEYYLYNPNTNELRGWLRTDGYLDAIEPISGWVSPRLQIQFDSSAEVLQIYFPNGDRFLSYSELAQQLEQERQRAQSAEERAARLAERLRQAGIDPDQV